MLSYVLYNLFIWYMFEFFVLRDFHVMTWTILQTMIGHDIYEFNYFGRFQGFFFVLSINVLDSII